jgi:hypothetical protein
MAQTLPQVPPLLTENNDEIGRPSRGVWLMIVSLLLAKVGTIAVIFAVDFSVTSATFVAVTTWLWVLALSLLLAAPVAFAVRIRRVRHRRTQLQRAEWMTE